MEFEKEMKISPIKEQVKKAKEFIEKWEKENFRDFSEQEGKNKFWTGFLQIFGLKYDDIEEILYQEKSDNERGHIDFYLKMENRNIIIEHKSRGIKLNRELKNQDETFKQANGYNNNLEFNEKAEYIITCNFNKMLIYDMNHHKDAPVEITLKDLEDKDNLEFLTNILFVKGKKGESHKVYEEFKHKQLSIEAGEKIGKIYNEVKKCYLEGKAEKDLNLDEQKNLYDNINKFCIRLVFLLYADSADKLNGDLYEYLKDVKTEDINDKLKRLFKALSTNIENRGPDFTIQEKNFPYINGGLFENDNNFIIPVFSKELRTLIFEEKFEWSKISPTIFGAIFESTLDPELRARDEVHFTSIENIHKVIDPLFLDGLKKELTEIKKKSRDKDKKLIEFQNKIASLKFFDPACGSR